MKNNEISGIKGRTVTRYVIEYKIRVTKVKKKAYVLARTKTEAKRGLNFCEQNPIVQAVYGWEEVTLPYNLMLPYVEKTEFLRGLSEMMDYKTCRWCKWFKDGFCTNEQAFELMDNLILYPFYEDGYLSEAIRKGFKKHKFKNLEQALIESELSKKRVEEIMQIFNAELKLDAQLNWTKSINDKVAEAIENFDFDFDLDKGVLIRDSAEFSCKYFW